MRLFGSAGLDQQQHAEPRELPWLPVPGRLIPITGLFIVPCSADTEVEQVDSVLLELESKDGSNKRKLGMLGTELLFALYCSDCALQVC